MNLYQSESSTMPQAVCYLENFRSSVILGWQYPGCWTRPMQPTVLHNISFLIEGD